MTIQRFDCSGTMVPVDGQPEIGGYWVALGDHQAELAALQERLEEKQAFAEVFYQRQVLAETQLKGAEQRNAEILGLLRDLYETVDFVWPEVDAILKSESGASE